MHIKDYITKQNIIFASEVSSKKAALELISGALAEKNTDLISNKLLDALLAREKLGSTGLGNGIAIPHCRMESLDQIHVLILKLEEGVEYEATDNMPVTFFCCMVVPEDANDEHLQLLASLAELLDNDRTRQAIHQCTSVECIFQLLGQNPKHLAA